VPINTALVGSVYDEVDPCRDTYVVGSVLKRALVLQCHLC
jgi:hypothetical protein